MTKTGTITRGSLLFGALLALGGCETQYGFYTPPVTVHVAPLNANYGNALAQNKALHVINPEPNTTETPPDLDGRRDALVIERYERGQVIAPTKVETGG